MKPLLQRDLEGQIEERVTMLPVGRVFSIREICPVCVWKNNEHNRDIWSKYAISDSGRLFKSMGAYQWHHVTNIKTPYTIE